MLFYFSYIPVCLVLQLSLKENPQANENTERVKGEEPTDSLIYFVVVPTKIYGEVKSFTIHQPGLQTSTK